MAIDCVKRATLLVLACRLVTACASCSDRIVVGVDYYPEQWPLQDLQDDMKAIKDDLGADIVRIGEFMWHEIEPRNGEFNFTLLDRIIQTAEQAGLEVMLGTPTATMPAWLYRAYPDVALQMPDAPEGYTGAKAGFGGRRQYAVTSPNYVSHVKRLVKTLAARYGQRRSITFWQVDNELGHEGSDLDFSDSSKKAWRDWLRKEYSRDIAKLNADWGTMFWGVTYNTFDEIPLPRFTIPGGSLSPNENFRSNQNPGMLLSFRQYRRDAITAYADTQVDILRASQVKGCVTTNAPGGFWTKALDHNDIFAKMDLPAYDNYPVWGGSLTPNSPSSVAMTLDTVRGWALSLTGRTGWMVAEQLIGAQGHDIIGFTPRPGQARAWAAASFLHGAVALNLFRYRAAVFGQEQFCYGVLDHATPRGTGRKWQEAKDIFGLAREHKDLWLGQVEAEVAVLYDGDNIFAWQGQPQSTAFGFEEEVHRLYYPFWRNGASIDILSSRHFLKNEAAENAVLKKYRVLVLPAMMLTSDKIVTFAERFVQSGGSLWVGFRSDLKDERGQIRRIPSRLARLAGVEVAEFESLNVGSKTTSLQRLGGSDTAEVSVWREGLRILDHFNPSAKAKAIWQYTDRFFGAQAYAAVTQREPNGEKGSEIMYVGAGIDKEALVPLAAASLQRQGVRTAGQSTNPNVEQVLRRDRKGKLWHISINHDEEQVSLRADKSLQLNPFEVDIREAPAFPTVHDRELYSV